MTLKLFEEPVETAATTQLDVSIATRIISAALASLVAVLPAVLAAFSAYRVWALFASIRNAETAGMAYISMGLHSINTLLVVALGISAFLAFVIALAAAVDPKFRLASVGLPLSIAIPFLAVLPGAFLWSVETTTLNILSGQHIVGSVDETAENLIMMLWATMACGALVVGITGICSVVSLILPVRRRADPLSLRRAFVWAVTGVLMLVVAGAYFIVV